MLKLKKFYIAHHLQDSLDVKKPTPPASQTGCYTVVRRSRFYPIVRYGCPALRSCRPA